MSKIYSSIQEKLNIDQETFDYIISDNSAKQQICEALFHCLSSAPKLRELASLLLQYIADVTANELERSRSDAEETKWITINGTHVPLDENGEVDKGGWNNDGGPGSGNHGHEGRPGEVGGSLPSGDSLNGRVSEAYKSGDYTEVGRAIRQSLHEMPVGSSLTSKGVRYTKTGENEFEFGRFGKKVTVTCNWIANSADLFNAENAPRFEDPKAEEVAEEMVANGKISPEDTSVEVSSFEPEPYKGIRIVEVDANQFQSLREELQKNTGAAVNNAEIKGYLGAIDEYRGADYTDIVAASAEFGGNYAEYSKTMNSEQKDRAKTNAERLERFIARADKYKGKVMRAIGFDIGGEYDDDGSTTADLTSLLEKCIPGKTIDMGHISSWTTQKRTISQILDARTGYDDTARESVQIVFTCNDSTSGVDIGRFSKHFTQGEVVFSKEQQFRVKNVTRSKTSLGVTRYDIEVEEAM